MKWHVYYFVWEYTNRKGRTKLAVKEVHANNDKEAVRKASKFLKRKDKDPVKKPLALHFFRASMKSLDLAGEVWDPIDES